MSDDDAFQQNSMSARCVPVDLSQPTYQAASMKRPRTVLQLFVLHVQAVVRCDALKRQGRSSLCICVPGADDGEGGGPWAGGLVGG